jgi:hypothetical protein
MAIMFVFVSRKKTLSLIQLTLDFMNPLLSSNFRNSNRELRGQSEYIQVRDDEDHFGGDQLDRLLVQARRARS